MFKRLWKLFASSFQIWFEAKAARMAAAMTYYAMLSLAPLLMMAIAIAGFVFGPQLAEDEIIEQVGRFTTGEIAQTVAGLIKNASKPSSGIVAGSISLFILLFGASGVFSQLHDTFNDIWNLPFEKTSGVLFTLKQRLIGVGMVLIAGIVLIATLGLHTTIASISEAYPMTKFWLNLADRGVSYLLIPLMIALIYWLIPSTKIHFLDVVPAAMMTAILISFSRFAIEMYLQFSSTSQVYGAAGSLVVLLIWIYVTGLVVFYGASFSRSWAETFGSRSELNSSLSESTSDAVSGRIKSKA